MGQSLILVLLLTTVALSSSNILPVNVNKQSLDLEDIYNDNIFSNRYQTRNVLNYINHIYENRPAKSKILVSLTDPDNKNEDILTIYNKHDNYNEGFRKKQWHNYPRQLDRLHQINKKMDENRNFDPSSKEQLTEEIISDNKDENEKTNEFLIHSNTDPNNLYETEIAANPLLILKIRLACLNTHVENANTPFANLFIPKLDHNAIEDVPRLSNESPVTNVLKIKREYVFNSQDESTGVPSENKAVSKRMFSLLTRLSNLNPRGHELQHRRHLHAFYGLPDSDGGRTLTAKTRATILRPPGSPLRWG